MFGTRKSYFPYISISHDECKDSKGNIFKTSVLKTEDFTQITEKEIDSFLDKTSSILKNLDSSKHVSFYMNGESYISSKENSELSGEITPPLAPLLIDIPNSDIIFYDDYFKVNHKAYRLIYLESYPSSLECCELQSLGDYICIFKKISSVNSKIFHERNRKSHHASFSNTDSDFEGQSSYYESDEILRDITLGDSCEFWTATWILVSDNDIDTLNEKTTAICHQLKLNDIRFIIEGSSFKSLKFGLSEVFNYILPNYLFDTSIRGIRTPLRYLTNILPLHKDSLHDEGRTFFTPNGSSVKLDLFNKNLQSRNVVLTGGTGSGKSFLANKIIEHYINEECHITIIDKGRSFKRLLEFYQGYSLSDKFNLFESKDLNYITEVVSCVLGGISSLERGKLKLHLSDYDFSCFSIESLTEHISKIYPEYRYGIYNVQGYLNNTQIDSDLVYCDVTDYPEDILQLIIIYLIDKFCSVKNKNKIFVIDESFAFLKDHKEYIEWMYRTVRKQGGLIMAISQISTILVSMKA
jgi:hypothetical protein